MQAKIDYERKEFHMEKLTMMFDENDRNVKKSKRLCTIVLKPKSETILQLVTTSAESRTGILPKMDVV
jgi:hypothetical protein